MLSQVNANVQEYTELINLKNKLATPPSVRKHSRLSRHRALRFDEIPCHRQAVERMVAVVIQAAEMKPGTKAGIEEI